MIQVPYLKQHTEDLPVFGKEGFIKTKLVKVKNLYANQPHIDPQALALKLKGKNLTQIYIVNYNQKDIVIDGHHTTVAKIMNGQERVKALYLIL